MFTDVSAIVAGGSQALDKIAAERDGLESVSLSSVRIAMGRLNAISSHAPAVPMSNAKAAEKRSVITQRPCRLDSQTAVAMVGRKTAVIMPIQMM